MTFNTLNQNTKALNERNFQSHIRSMERNEYMLVAELKLKGASCETCIHSHTVKYSTTCTAQKRKQVKPYNICHRHCKL